MADKIKGFRSYKKMAPTRKVVVGWVKRSELDELLRTGVPKGGAVLFLNKVPPDGVKCGKILLYEEPA